MKATMYILECCLINEANIIKKPQKKMQRYEYIIKD